MVTINKFSHLYSLHIHMKWTENCFWHFSNSTLISIPFFIVPSLKCDWCIFKMDLCILLELLGRTNLFTSAGIFRKIIRKENRKCKQQLHSSRFWIFHKRRKILHRFTVESRERESRKVMAFNECSHTKCLFIQHTNRFIYSRGFRMNFESGRHFKNLNLHKRSEWRSIAQVWSGH